MLRRCDFETNAGSFDMELNPTHEPLLQGNVDNLLQYVTTGRYDNTVINRAEALLSFKWVCSNLRVRTVGNDQRLRPDSGVSPVSRRASRGNSRAVEHEWNGRFRTERTSFGTTDQDAPQQAVFIST